MSSLLRVLRYRLVVGCHRQRSAYLSIVLLVGLVGGLSMAGVAGGRKTASSFITYLTSTKPSTIGVFSRYVDPALGFRTGYDAAVQRTISHLPLVARASSAIVFDGNIDLNSVKGTRHPVPRPGAAPPAILGSMDGDFTKMDRVTLVAGRRLNPKRLDEAMVTPQTANDWGMRIGSVIQFPIYTDAQVLSPKPFKPYLFSVRIVGEYVMASSLIESDIGSLNADTLILSPAMTRVLATKYATGTETFFSLRGGDANAKRVLSEVYHVIPAAEHLGTQRTASFLPVVQSAITPEAIALGTFGVIAGVAVLLIAGLIIARMLRDATTELRTLRSLGADQAMLFGDGLVGLLAALTCGSLLAVLVAVALSPLAPLGPVHPVYPLKGISFGWTVLGLGFLGLMVVLGLLTGLLARREARRVTYARRLPRARSEPRWVRSAPVTVLPISVSSGIRFALESGRGRNAAPVRSALAGAVLAVTVVVTTVTFGASLDNLVSHPRLYGWNWDYAMLSSFSGAEDLPAHQAAVFLNHDHDVAAWSGANVTNAKLDGQRAQVFAQRPNAPVTPPILSGHGLQTANQLVLGPKTMRDLHKKLGDTVTFSTGLSKPIKLTIVGTSTMPALGQDTAMGTGAIVARSNFPAALLNIQSAQIPGPNIVLVRIRAGVSRAAAYRSLTAIDVKINAIPAASGLAGSVIGVLRPTAIVNFHSMGTTPTLLASGLALGAVVALGLTLTASVRRRRRDLALLKALGLTQRQLMSTIAWQATANAVIGVVLGVPLGIIAGRVLWSSFARSISAVPDPAVSVPTTILVAVGALPFANLVAVLPARSAARTRAALVLRAE